MKAAVEILLLSLQTSSVETKQTDFQRDGEPGEDPAGSRAHATQDGKHRTHSRWEPAGAPGCSLH